MNVVDSSGWLEYFIDGPNARIFSAPIRDVDSLVVPTIIILEVFKRVLQQGTEEGARLAIGPMFKALISDLTPDIALAAAQIGHELKLPLADSVILATARAHDAVLWTQDAHFRGIEGVRYLPARGAGRGAGRRD